MRQWTLQERQQQAQLIQQWQPWKTAGVKTPEGKAISCMNAKKHGAFGAETKRIWQVLREQNKLIRMLGREL